MEKKLNNISKLTLKEISLRRVVAILWSQMDNINSIFKYGVSDKVNDNLIILLSELELPPSLAEELKYLVKPIAIEVCDWIYFHGEYLYKYAGSGLVTNIFQELSWTVLGAIDYRKTAENIILRRMISEIDRYRIACLYCLDDYIPDLWEQLPEKFKMHIYKKEGPVQVTEPLLDFCWAYILQGESSKLDNMPGRFLGSPTIFNQYAFEYAACRGNKVATEYFFQKLTLDEKEASLLRTTQAVVKLRMRRREFGWFGSKETTKVLCYLLSMMSSEMQLEIFKEQPCTFLICFLDWPWQHLFLDIAELMWTFLSEDVYNDLSFYISFHIEGSDYYFPKLFQEFYRRSPRKFRKQLVSTVCEAGLFFPYFFKLKDSETIRVVFRNIDYEDRKKLILNSHLFDLFCQSILKGDWHLVELCLQEATLSSEDKAKFKSDFCRYVTMHELSVDGCKQVVMTRDNTGFPVPDPRPIDWSIFKVLFDFLDEINPETPSSKKMRYRE